MEIEDAKDKENLFNIDNLLEILGNPTRRVILAKLAKVPLGASELAASLGKKISRQAIHSQLKMLSDNGIIESFGEDPRNVKYRIKSNLSLRIDITPDYYNVNYRMLNVDQHNQPIELEATGCHVDYNKLKNPDKKLRFLGKQIKEIEQKIKRLEEERNDLLQNKECFIIELKNIMSKQYEEKLRHEQPNLEKEIFYTLFYDPLKYFKRINIDKLLDDMFFSDMDLIRRDQHKVSVRYLLRDLSKYMDILREDEDDWFFDI
ncbi:MAG: ArsR/SmtB family transcription factor [Candidatus Hermodarchaeota archaeon]